MKLNSNVCISALVLCLLFFAQPSFSATGFPNPLVSMNLSSDQIAELSDVFEAYSGKQLQLQAEMDRNISEWKIEIRKRDRFDTPEKEAASTKKSSKLGREIGRLLGESIKATVTYLIESKNVFTIKQREQLFLGLQKLDFNLPDTLFVITEKDLLLLDLDLSMEQRRQILTLRADMEKKAIDIGLEIDFDLIAMQMEVEKEDRDPQKIDQLFLSITDEVSEMIMLRITSLINANRVLKIEQKKKLQSLVLMQWNY